ncbi:HET-domain-containing protein [Lophiostoma macrostomum CBS 122681]|uniref:HET-domain-containing protein n=1 Tax=Lophiostoma macrostomum CBS 122681 TaxID=1314788 RepID=A0A6A6STF0_9PLEO|nr:HET-domain-containing protein [Lophiostoma macrostomum CBS 122681]
MLSDEAFLETPTGSNSVTYARAESIAGSLRCISLPGTNVSCTVNHTSLPPFAWRVYSPVLDTWDQDRFAPLMYARVALQNVTQPRESAHPLPSRVLDLGGYLSDSDVRLMEPPNGMAAHYITLSYRWGTSRNMTTTKANRLQYLNRIHETDMPKVFQDAVFVCRSLKIRYLWIDSLCIIQDDLLDWKAQSKLMGDIYHNAFCTIAAHSAQDDGEGFLRRALTWPDSVTFHDSDGRFNEFSPNRDFFHEVNRLSPLSERGWVLQERLLSKQTLHFVARHILLETTAAFQGLNIAQGKRFSIRGPEDQQRRSFSALNPSPDTQRVEWLLASEFYSHCHLTYVSDKLPAIAGIVSRLQGVLPRAHICGLWEGYIREGLLWARDRALPMSRPDTQRAPSWSWAALDGPIVYIFKDRDILFTDYYIEEPQCSQANNSTLDGSSLCLDASVSLQIYGIMRPLPALQPYDKGIDLGKRRNLLVGLENSYRQTSSWKGRPGNFEFFGVSELLHVANNLPWGPRGCVILDEDCKKETQQHLDFVPVALLGSVGFGRVCVGLVVTCSGTDKATYQRVGLGCIVSFDKTDAAYIPWPKEIADSDRRMITVV